MKTVTIHEAKTTLSALPAEVEEGEQVVNARNGKPIAQLTGSSPRRAASRACCARCRHGVTLRLIHRSSPR
jgi:antitoxin (DNA-binding transcriptional repressor) of toxin-antitoxin stability system